MRATSIATFPLAVEALAAHAVPLVVVVVVIAALLVRLDAVLVLVAKTLIAVRVAANVVTDVDPGPRKRTTEDLLCKGAQERLPKSLTLRWTTTGVVARLPTKAVPLLLVKMSPAVSLRLPLSLEDRTTTWVPRRQPRTTTLTLWLSKFGS